MLKHHVMFSPAPISHNMTSYQATGSGSDLLAMFRIRPLTVEPHLISLALGTDSGIGKIWLGALLKSAAPV